MMMRSTRRDLHRPAVAILIQANEAQRVGLVDLYFTRSAHYERIEVIDRSGGTGDPIWAVRGYRREE